MSCPLGDRALTHEDLPERRRGLALVLDHESAGQLALVDQALAHQDLAEQAAAGLRHGYRRSFPRTVHRTSRAPCARSHLVRLHGSGVGLSKVSATEDRRRM